MPSSELYVGNLDPETRSQEVKEIFERYGTVNRCEVKFGGSAYSAAFGFVGFDSSDEAERAQQKEHGRSHRGRRLIVEFTKTTPGQNGRRGQYIDGDDRMRNGNSNGRDRERSRNRDDVRGGYQRQRRSSPSYSRKSSKDRSNSDDARQKKDRSRSPRNHKSNSKRHRSSSNNDKRRTSSHSHKNGNSKKH